MRYQLTSAKAVEDCALLMAARDLGSQVFRWGSNGI